MPTLPPEPTADVKPRQERDVEPHRERKVAESFGADAQRYDRARPSYPDAMVDRIVAASPGRDFVDVGIGTGIAARQFEAAGRTVLGVEVDERMAELARRSGFDVEVSTFETWDPAGRTFDAVVAAQAWHWVDPVAGAAKAARVLRPGGRIALFWNVFQPPPEVSEGIGEVYGRVLPDVKITFRRTTSTLETYEPMFTTASDGITQVGAFGEPERWRFEWTRSYTRDEWLDQVPTFGGHSQLPPDKQAELLAGIGAVVDSVGGGFTMEYTTVVVTATRIQ